MGKGNAQAADQAAIKAMHHTLNSISFSGSIVLGEGNAGSTPMLFAGEEVGHGGGEGFDLAVDALECTRSVAFGRSNAMAVVALAPKGDFVVPPDTYMYKIAVGPDASSVIDIQLPVRDNLHRIAEAKNYSINDLTVVALDRERHADLIAEIRDTGARLHLIPDGDVAAAIAAAMPGSGIDVLVGSGSAYAGLLAASALRCINGELIGRLSPTNLPGQTTSTGTSGGKGDMIYRSSDLVRGNNTMFVATGVTDGELLNGVRYRKDGATTNSMVMRSWTRTRRFIITEHYFGENPEY
jgi:fructose-1,6-bisphosphatase II